MHPFDFMPDKQIKELALKEYMRQFNKEEFETAEDGSQYRFEKIFKKHYFWWLVHNLVAHTLIGLIPAKAFFNFHDYTSRKMRKK